MADRALLHRNKLEDFKAWLVATGWTLEPIKPSDVFKVIQARKDSRKAPLMVYDRMQGKHLSLLDRDTDIVRAFINERKPQ